MRKLLVEDCQKLPISLLQLDSGAEQIYIGEQAVRIVSTRCNYGGLRAWFVCPQCGRRVGVLYRKPLLTHFLCRHCQNLSYQLTKYRRSKLEEFYRRIHQTVKGLKLTR